MFAEHTPWSRFRGVGCRFHRSTSRLSGIVHRFIELEGRDIAAEQASTEQKLTVTLVSERREMSARRNIWIAGNQGELDVSREAACGS